MRCCSMRDTAKNCAWLWKIISGMHVSVSIVPGEVHAETPAMRLARLAQKRQAEAVIAIEGDPQLQALIKRFDGELDRSSIVPTDV